MIWKRTRTTNVLEAPHTNRCYRCFIPQERQQFKSDRSSESVTWRATQHHGQTKRDENAVDLPETRTSLVPVFRSFLGKLNGPHHWQGEVERTSHYRTKFWMTSQSIPTFTTMRVIIPTCLEKNL